MHTIDHQYTEDLTHAKHTALKVLLDLLQASDDPIEKRRLATAILRIPTPRPPSPASREKVAESGGATPDEGKSSPSHSAIRNPQSEIPSSSSLGVLGTGGAAVKTPPNPAHPLIGNLVAALIARAGTAASLPPPTPRPDPDAENPNPQSAARAPP